MGNITCIGEQSCQGATFPIPDPSISLTIPCNEIGKCEDSTIYCPSNANCNIICIGKDSCDGTNIIWPTNTLTNNTLICEGQNHAMKLIFHSNHQIYH